MAELAIVAPNLLKFFGSAAVDAFLAAQPGPVPKLHKLVELAGTYRGWKRDLDGAFEAVVFRKSSK